MRGLAGTFVQPSWFLHMTLYSLCCQFVVYLGPIYTYPDSFVSANILFRRIRVDGKRNRNKMFADTNESGYVWTGPFNDHITRFKRIFRDKDIFCMQET